ncbi:hypothetical protein [Streptomyces sp. NPDC056061]|uniref:hypothetical protein n=1 Tax=Streptomyces sp. NPDC056061 TaxID=3345700 RepID=UPI0035DF28E4
MDDPAERAVGARVLVGDRRPVDAVVADLDLWSTTDATGDPLHRCSLAHYMADLHEDPAQALARDIRALDAADALTDQRVQAHHAGLQVAGFHPSPHLDLADNYRRLGSFDAATEHIGAAREHAPNLPRDAYGALLRSAIEQVAEAITRRSTAKRSS